jgi:transcriptional regulator with XRE-family HTH domain
VTVDAVEGGDAQTDASSLAAIGRKIRLERKIRGLSIDRLSEASGVSVGVISTVERGKANPSFYTLVSIARGLGYSVGWLFEDPPQTSPVVRRAERARRESGSGSVQEMLTPDDEGIFEALWLDLAPDHAPGTTQQHDGEDFLLVLSGRMYVDLGRVRHVLETGDSIRFPGTTPHLSGNLGDERCTAIWVSAGAAKPD